MGTFAPARDDVLSSDRLASAIKKARDESAMCATLNPIGELGSPSSGGDGDGMIRPVTPDVDDGSGPPDYAAYEVGGDMTDEDAGGGLGGLSDSEPGTPDSNIAGVRAHAGDRIADAHGDSAAAPGVHDSEEEEPPPALDGGRAQGGGVDVDGSEPGTP